MPRPNLLVVCGRNKRRSRTAEYLFKNDSRFGIRSVGLSPRSERQIKENDISWANIILVMEDAHSGRIQELYRHCDIPEMHVLHIEDEYDYLDDELIEMLHDRIDGIFN